MIGLAIAAMLVVGGFVAMAFAALLLLVFRLVVFVVLLPFRLLLALLVLPFVLLKLVFVAIGMVLLVAAVAAGGLILTMGLLVPLLPIALIVGLVWLLAHKTTPGVVLHKT